MPLAQTISGVPAASNGASAVGDGAHGLGGNDQEDRLGGDGSGEIAGNDDTVVDADAGQEPAFALGLQCFRIGGVRFPQRDLAAGPRAGQRQGRAPGARADDRDAD